MTQPPLYNLKSVVKTYSSRGRLAWPWSSPPPDVVALRKVDLSVSRGEFVGIVGRSGEGKSTLLNLLGGLDRPSKGAIEFNGQPLSAVNLTRLRRDKIGFVFQMFHLLPNKTALDNVALGLTVKGINKSKARVAAERWLDSLGLLERRNHRPHALSGGERQRVAIARAMIKEPLTVLADEPTGNLDKESRTVVLDALKDASRRHGVTVVLVTHNQTDADRYSDRVVTLKDRMIPASSS